MASKSRSKKIILVAVPHGKGALKLSSGAHLYVSTYTQAGITVVCGFSTVHDVSSAFDPGALESVIHQWNTTNGRGWRFQICDRNGYHVEMVDTRRPRPKKRKAKR